MPYINDTYQFRYAADNLTSGLTDVLCYVLDSTNILYGPFLMTETSIAGIYVYSYTPLIRGQYTFEANSVTKPKKFILTVNFDELISVVAGLPTASFDNN